MSIAIRFTNQYVLLAIHTSSSSVSNPGVGHAKILRAKINLYLKKLILVSPSSKALRLIISLKIFLHGK